MAVAEKKTVRLKDVAEATGFSSVTVGNVLLGSGGANVRISQKTREKVLESAKKLGYSPNRFAQHLAGKRTRLIGGIIDTFANERIYDTLSEVERFMWSHGYRLMVGQSHGEPSLIERHLRDFTSYKVEGMICFSHNYPGQSREIAQLFRNVPNVVFVSRPSLDTTAVSYVDSDVVMSSRISVEHLAQRGRTKPAIFLLSSGSAYMSDRLEGFKQGLASSGLAFDEDRVVYLERPSKPGRYDRDIVEKNLLSVIRDHAADSVIMDDNAALLAIGALHQNNISVPDDVAVVGSDNLHLSGSFTPPLTTVDLRNREMARRAGEILLAMLNETLRDARPRQEIVEPELIVRSSS